MKRLIERFVADLLPEDAPVLQLGEPLACVEGVDGSREDEQLVLGQLLLHTEVVHPQPHGDVGVVQKNLLKHRRVAVFRKGLERKCLVLLQQILLENIENCVKKSWRDLEGVVEVSAVPVGPEGKSGEDGGVQLPGGGYW